MWRSSALVVLLCACDPGVFGDGRDASPNVDAGPSARDAGSRDAGSFDASSVDSGPSDAGTRVSGLSDSGLPDAGPMGVDAGTPDAGVDAGTLDPPALDLSRVTWLHTDVSGWPEVAALDSVTFRSGQICLDYNRADVWPIRTISGGVDVVANPWVFIWRDGRWYGATWEWLRPGQRCKAQTSVAGDHIKRSPFDAASGWRPTSGEVLYFMVSGLARSTERNAMERTRPVRVVWP